MLAGGLPTLFWWVQVATNLVAKLLALEAMNSEKDIKIYINSGGEYASALLGARLA